MKESKLVFNVKTTGEKTLCREKALSFPSLAIFPLLCKRSRTEPGRWAWGCQNDSILNRFLALLAQLVLPLDSICHRPSSLEAVPENRQAEPIMAMGSAPLASSQRESMPSVEAMVRKVRLESKRLGYRRKRRSAVKSGPRLGIYASAET